jgi:inhibitor of growth protein 3
MGAGMGNRESGIGAGTGGNRSLSGNMHPLARTVQRSNNGSGYVGQHGGASNYGIGGNTTATTNSGSKRRKVTAGGNVYGGEAEDSYEYTNSNNVDDYDEMQESPISRPGTPTARRTKQRTRTTVAGSAKEDEPVYCYCQQVSFGEMVGCDGADCKREWFHLPCIGLTSPPKGQWYCQDCSVKYKKKDKR